MASQEKMRYLLFYRIRDTTPTETLIVWLVAVRPKRNSEEKGCISVEQRCVETGLSQYAAEKRQLFLMKSRRSVHSLLSGSALLA